jgi:hypothetical protein
MTNILQYIENLFAPEEAAIANFAKGAAAALGAWVKGDVEIVVADADAAWAKLLPIITAIPPSQYAILQGLVAKATADAASGDYTAIAADVMTEATRQELTWVMNLGQGLLGIIVAFLAYKPTPAAPPAAKAV